MTLNTASAVMSLARNLETESSRFYESLAASFTGDSELFLSFVKENKRNVTDIERAYYSVITDAIEGCFAFEINPDDYKLKTELAENATRLDALDAAIEIEDKILKFYTDAAEQSKSLMADVPRAFLLVAKKRPLRKAKLVSLKEG